MSLAPVAYLLYQKVMRHDPSDPTWLGGTGSSCPVGTPASPSTSSSTSAAGPGLEPTTQGPRHLGQPHPGSP